MDENILKYLVDIQHSINNINTFLQTRPRQYKTFCDDICFRSAVQWEIAVIGEAMNRVLKLEPEIQITSARKIVNTRNYIIHGYDSLRLDILWSIVINHLPILEEEIAAILSANGID